MRGAAPWCAVALILLIRPVAAPPSAELVVFATGRVLPISGRALDGGSVVLSLRSGGEVVVDPRLIYRIEADPAGETEPAREMAARPTLPARPYADIIEDASARHGVDPRLVHAMIEVESAYRADATSPKGAVGLMQLMPATVTRYAVGDPFDPVSNVNAGIRYLRSLLDEFGTRYALAAYNAGAGAVRRFDGMPPYPETRRYVSRVLALVDEQRSLGGDD